ncbi:MAG: hypothetical protein CVU89_17015, partial [Firmicutes bacterium HGW-Firmicutes-14]
MLKVRKYHRGYKLISGFLAFMIVFSSLVLYPVSVNNNGLIHNAFAEEDITSPVVSITSPANNSTVSPSGETVTVTADAGDAVGVVKVEFYVDGAKVGESVYAPYEYAWQSVAGTHTLTAKAYDAAGNVGTSAGISIKVPARVTLTNPADGSTTGGLISTF